MLHKSGCWMYLELHKVRIGRIRHTHTHTHAQTRTRTDTHAQTHTHVLTDTHIQTHACTHTDTHKQMNQSLGDFLSFQRFISVFECSALWDVTSCCLVEIHQSSAGIYSPVHGINPDKYTRCHTSKDSLVHGDTNTVSHKKPTFEALWDLRCSEKLGSV
jgi:hypothetical protein